MPVEVEAAEIRVAPVQPGERPIIEVRAGRLRLTPSALTLLMAPARAQGIELHELHNGIIVLRWRWKSLAGVMEIAPRRSDKGRLLLEIVSVKAGLLPVPGFMVEGLLPALADRAREKLGGRGIYPGAGGGLEIRPDELAAARGIGLPPLKWVGVSPREGVVLEW